MVLEGKCEKDFFKWFSKDRALPYFAWERLEDNEKFIWIQDFADSVGMILEANSFGELFVSRPRKGSPMEKTRPQARTEAVKQFNKIYNGDSKTTS